VNGGDLLKKDILQAVYPMPRFWTKTNKIAKFSILDEKRNSQFCTKFGRKMATERWNKNVKFFSRSLA